MYKGHLLIAHPLLLQPLFAQSVIYICQHSSSGTTGVILNKPNDQYTIADVAIDRGFELASSEPLYTGGPVRPNSVMILHTDGWYCENTIEVGEGMGLTSDELMIEKLSMGNAPRHWRVFNGMCIWAPGQLEKELNHPRGWMMMPGDEFTIFEMDAFEHWQATVDLYTQRKIDTYL